MNGLKNRGKSPSIWHDATAPLVGEDNADAATDKLLGMCTAKIYGADAAEKYAADPDRMASTAISWAGFRSS